MPAYSIFCSGRRYPNAPGTAKGGCQERPPPYYFFPFTFFLDGPFQSESLQFQPCRFSGHAPTEGWDVRSNWNRDPTLGGGKNINVALRVHEGQWCMEVHYQRVTLTNNNGILFRRSFPDGFPKWPEFYEVPFSHITTSWPFFIPSIVNVYIGVYALCPVDLCLP